jgi:hypothetical protein
MTKDKKGYRMRYATSHGGGITIVLPEDPRKHVCEACGKSVFKGEIKVTALHHWKYAYRAETVRKNPMLALENTTEYCFACHRIADGIRALLDVNPERAVAVLETLPPYKRDRLLMIIKRLIELHGNKMKEIAENPVVKSIFQRLQE